MGIETVVGLTQQVAIEAPLTAAGFVSRNKQDALAPRIERKGNPPFAIRCA